MPVLKPNMEGAQSCADLLHRTSHLRMVRWLGVAKTLRLAADLIESQIDIIAAQHRVILELSGEEEIEL